VRKDKEAIEAFNSLVAIKLGDGAKVLFWTDRWIRGAAMKDLAPIVFESVGAQKRCKRTVSEALENHSWVDDVGPGLGPDGLLQLAYPGDRLYHTAGRGGGGCVRLALVLVRAV
jgi:hypothetical protein